MPTLSDLAVIIPVAAQDKSWMELVHDLKFLPMDCEIIFVSPEVPIEAPRVISGTLGSKRKIRWLKSAPGRAIQLNVGAQATQKDYLWFLHADSRLTPGSLAALEKTMHKNPHALYYFDLAFRPDDSKLMSINAAGVWFRSHVLKIPFGDQGLCIFREIFEYLGGFSETVAYGEDHLLVWEARRANVPVIGTGHAITTSARKYEKNGWLSTTLSHLYLTAKQALPESIHLVRSRWIRPPKTRKNH